MKTFRTEITISEDKTLTIKELPFPTGDKVEVVVRSSKRRKKRGERYPLRGKPIFGILILLRALLKRIGQC